jgi:hypothetical protein
MDTVSKHNGIIGSEMAAGRNPCCHFRLIWQQGLVTSKTVENDGTANYRDTNAVKTKHF